jgi:uncharacterized membrane protein
MLKRMVIAALALIGGFVALYLTLYKMGMIGQLTCTIGGCEKVNTSKWATFLGFPVALWGVGFYVVTFAVAFVGTMDRFANVRGISLILTALSAVGVLFSAWLTYLELFVIHAICQYCVVSAIIVCLIFIVSIMDLRQHASRMHS